ncbi:insulinase family (Peptidase family M16) [Cyanobium sp. PCC 7001]|uniref:M16 family metallopeptidase n=1 Tax=Cyanobium sp. PCC 7001 TaxID=180281 RepID=UPI0001805A70|nr:pitrilysin family protein [Cyanobium sp. PCC 7001]EDY39837.1 insulinase family (Peptidase family M16) [Cyanobium sp. PCC 7001]
MSRWTSSRLAGGLPLVSQHRPGVGLVAARLWIRGGSSVEGPGMRGAMQLLAGVMTRGCGELDAEQLADLVEGRGAALRSEAHEDALVISLKCASSDLLELLPLLIAMARDPALEDDQVTLERDLNLQNLQRQQEDPFQLAHDHLRRLLYDDGPYGHDPLGVPDELSRLGPGEIRPQLADLGRHGAVLVLCGDLPDPDAVRQCLNAQLALTPWPTAAPQPAPQPAPLRPGSAGADLALVPQDTEQLVLMLGSATVPLGNPDALCLRLLQAHAGVGMSSRLFVVMREERGLAYDVGVHMPGRCGPSPFVWHMSTSADRAAEALDCLLDEWMELGRSPLNEDELVLAKAKFRGQEAMGRQTCGQVADRQALVLGHGLPATYVHDALAEAEGLAAISLQAAAQRQLEQPRLSLCGPGPALEAAAEVWRRRQPHGPPDTR